MKISSPVEIFPDTSNEEVAISSACTSVSSKKDQIHHLPQSGINKNRHNTIIVISFSLHPPCL